MKRPKIKNALAGAFMLMGIMFSGFAAYSVICLQKTNSYVGDLATAWMPSTGSAQTIAVNVWQLRVAYRDHILATDDAGRSKAETRISDVNNALQSTIAAYESLDTTNQDAKITDGIRADLQAYAASGARLLDFSRQGQDEKAITALILRHHQSETEFLQRQRNLSRQTRRERKRLSREASRSITHRWC
ncbi:MCP four helix bundle domain-containing protein [Neorhizobium lilium]|nr:MCP four helix bundle domain-containing protein [Neorhizobium lilium]